MFRNFMACVNTTDLPLAIAPPRKNPDAAAWGVSRQIRCREFAAGSSQRCRKPLKCTSMTCKCLNLMKIKSTNLVFASILPSAIWPQARKSNRAIGVD
jgi:hypothetical protein